MKKKLIYALALLLGISNYSMAMDNPSPAQGEKSNPPTMQLYSKDDANQKKLHPSVDPKTTQFELWNKAAANTIFARFCNKNTCTEWSGLFIGDRMISNENIYMLEYYINSQDDKDIKYVEDIECFTFNPNKKVLVRVGKEKSNNDPTKPDPTFFGEQTGTGPGPIGEFLSAIRHVFPESKGLISKTETGISLRNAANDKTDIIWIPAPELEWKNKALTKVRNAILQINENDTAIQNTLNLKRTIKTIPENSMHKGWTIFHEIALWTSLTTLDHSELTSKAKMISDSCAKLYNILNEENTDLFYSLKNNWGNTINDIRYNKWIAQNVNRFLKSLASNLDSENEKSNLNNKKFDKKEKLRLLIDTGELKEETAKEILEKLKQKKYEQEEPEQLLKLIKDEGNDGSQDDDNEE